MIYKRSFLGIPIARRSNRRWLIVGYWTVVLALTLSAVALLSEHRRSSAGLQVLCTYVFIFAATGLGRMVWETSFTPDPGIRTLFDSALREQRRKNPPMDERQRREWERAHATAYALLSLAAIFALPLQPWRLLPQASELRVPLILFVVLAIVNLPQSILLWNEPDMETPE